MSTPESTSPPLPGDLYWTCLYDGEDTHCIILRFDGLTVHFLRSTGKVHSRPDFHFLAM